jgi:hypothetical protein
MPRKQHYIVVLRKLLSSLEIIQAQPTTSSLAFKVQLHSKITVVKGVASLVWWSMRVKPQLSVNMIMLLPSGPTCWTIQTSQGTSMHTTMLAIIIGAICLLCRSCKSPHIPLGLLMDRGSSAVKGSWPAFIYDQVIVVATIATLIMIRKWFGWFPNFLTVEVTVRYHLMTHHPVSCHRMSYYLFLLPIHYLLPTEWQYRPGGNWVTVTNRRQRRR